MRYIAIICLVTSLAGCEHFRQTVKDANAPGPGGGPSAVERFTASIPGLLLNPLNPEGLGSAAGLLLTLFFGKKGTDLAAKKIAAHQNKKDADAPATTPNA